MSHDNDSTPFLPDPSIPEISSSGVDPSFTFVPDEPLSIPTLAHSVRWKWFGVTVGAIAALILISLGLAFLLPNALITPEKTVRSYYAAMQMQDSGLMRKYLDTDDPTISIAMPLVQDIQSMAASIADQTGLNLNVGWEFKNLVFKRVRLQGSYAQVVVSGQFHLYEVNSNIGVTVPYSMTHNLVKKNGTWLITTVNAPSR